MKHFENFQNKIGSKCCRWSSLNAPGTEILIWSKKPDLLRNPTLHLQSAYFGILSRQHALNPLFLHQKFAKNWRFSFFRLQGLWENFSKFSHGRAGPPVRRRCARARFSDLFTSQPPANWFIFLKYLYIMKLYLGLHSLLMLRDLASFSTFISQSLKVCTKDGANGYV